MTQKKKIFSKQLTKDTIAEINMIHLLMNLAQAKLQLKPGTESLGYVANFLALESHFIY